MQVAYHKIKNKLHKLPENTADKRCENVAPLKGAVISLLANLPRKAGYYGADETKQHCNVRTE